MKKVFLIVALLGLGITFSNAQTQTAVTPQKNEVTVTDQTVPAAEKKDVKCTEKSSNKSCCKKSSASTSNNGSGVASVSDKKECTTKEGEAKCKKNSANGKSACCKGHGEAHKTEAAPK